MSDVPPPTPGALAHTVPGQQPQTAVVWADPHRQRAFSDWLNRLAATKHLLPDSLHLASADASFRRYLRIATGSGEQRIIMDAPPDKEDCASFVRVAQLMAEARVRAPEVLAWDQAQGFMLLTDLGEHTMMSRLNEQDSASAAPLYRQAIQSLVRWQLASRPNVLPPYDEALLMREMQLFADWYVARHRGLVLSDEQQATLQQAFATIAAHNLRAPAVFVHRDYMARNLMLGEPDLGVLDFQDAVFGPITYDIASLMRDAFISWDEEFVLDITVRYWQAAQQAGLPVGADFGEFYRGVEWMGLQRHLKVAGIFARLTLRDGKPKYLQDAPRFIGYIRATAARYRELAPLLRLVDQIEGHQAPVGLAFGRV
jgi:aminoglycoside/choline kinase family phosphotransferase